MTEIVWEEPPAQHSASADYGKWGGILAALVEHPGKWANLGPHGLGTAHNIKNGLMRGTRPAGTFDAVMRANDKKTKTGTLYVRYVGGGDAGASSATSAEVGQ